MTLLFIEYSLSMLQALYPMSILLSCCVDDVMALQIYSVYVCVRNMHQGMTLYQIYSHTYVYVYNGTEEW